MTDIAINLPHMLGITPDAPKLMRATVGFLSRLWCYRQGCRSHGSENNIGLAALPHRFEIMILSNMDACSFTDYLHRLEIFGGRR